MTTMVSSIYQVIKFPHKGKIITIDYHSFFHQNPSQLRSNITLIDNSTKSYENMGVELYPTFMGTLNLIAPLSNIELY